MTKRLTPVELLARATPDARVLAVAWALREAAPVFERDGFADTYMDGVVGMWHTVDRRLPLRVVEAIEAAEGIPSAEVRKPLYEEVIEPMTALTDFDWECSDNAKLALHSAYNLLNACDEPDKDHAQIALSQAVSAALELGYHGSAPERVQAFFDRWRVESGLDS